jgi:hypothetical protein
VATTYKKMEEDEMSSEKDSIEALRKENEALAEMNRQLGIINKRMKSELKKKQRRSHSRRELYILLKRTEFGEIVETFMDKVWEESRKKEYSLDLTINEIDDIVCDAVFLGNLCYRDKTEETEDS